MEWTDSRQSPAIGFRKQGKKQWCCTKNTKCFRAEIIPNTWSVWYKWHSHLTLHRTRHPHTESMVHKVTILCIMATKDKKQVLSHCMSHTKFCKLSRLWWAGHVIRQVDDDLSRTVLLSEPGGKRPRGRPRLRWEDGVEEDVARPGCRNWKIVALNQEGWRKLLKEAEAHPRL